VKIGHPDHHTHGTHWLLIGIVSIAALMLEARVLTSPTTDYTHRICFEQMLGENLLPERPLMRKSRDQKPNANLLNDIVYRRVVRLPDLPTTLVVSRPGVADKRWQK
jgi:hypothetical protein